MVYGKRFMVLAEGKEYGFKDLMFKNG